MPAQVAVDAGGGGRVGQVAGVRIDAGQLGREVAPPAQVVLLVIVLGPGELAGRKELGPNLAPLLALLGQGLLGDPPLFLVVVKDDRGVLPGKGRLARVVAGPKALQQLLVGDLGGVIVDLDALRVVADAVVGRIGRAAARIADAGADDAGETPEPGVGAPESTEGKGRGLGPLGSGAVDGGNCGRRRGAARGRIVLCRARRKREQGSGEQGHSRQRQTPGLWLGFFTSSGHSISNV